TARPDDVRRRGPTTRPGARLATRARRARATGPCVPPRRLPGSERAPCSCSHCYLRPVATFDDRVTIATPEGIELELVLAGVGSRFAASLLDVAVQLGAIFALAVVLGPLGSNGYVVALFLVAIFLILFAYDIALETWNRGRRIGKLAAGLRVVRVGGAPERVLTAAVRNFLRLVDSLPAFYVAGAVAILLTGRNQRLGDLAAD